MSFAFPVLVADVGGTNARFSVQEKPDASLSEPVHVHTGDYPGLAEAIEFALPKLPARPRSVIACGAGPIVDGKLKLTNAAWHINGEVALMRLSIELLRFVYRL